MAIQFRRLFCIFRTAKSNRVILLESVAGCYNKVRQVLQSVTVITKTDVTHTRSFIFDFWDIKLVPVNSAWNSASRNLTVFFKKMAMVPTKATKLQNSGQISWNVLLKISWNFLCKQWLQGLTNLIFAPIEFNACKMLLRARLCMQKYVCIKKLLWALIYKMLINTAMTSLCVLASVNSKKHQRWICST